MNLTKIRIYRECGEGEEEEKMDESRRGEEGDYFVPLESP